MAAYLEIKNLVSGYGLVQVLHQVSLTIQKGEIVSIIGANGAGKSTLLRTISGLQPIHQGSIIFNQEAIHHWDTSKRIQAGLSHVLEGRQLFASLSVEDNLLMGSIPRSDNIKADQENLYQLFPILGEKKKQLAANLSGGQQQILAIARALMSRPQLLLLDEPSMGLSPLLQKEIFKMIVSLKQKGITIVLVEQNAFQAMEISDQSFVLENGEIVLSGESSSLIKNSKIKDYYLGG